MGAVAALVLGSLQPAGRGMSLARSSCRYKCKKESTQHHGANARQNSKYSYQADQCFRAVTRHWEQETKGEQSSFFVMIPSYAEPSSSQNKTDACG